MIREACLRVLVLCTFFLKEAAAYGLCLAEIGEMMSREFRSGEEEPSELEVICMEARRMIKEREVLSPKADLEHEEFQFPIDYGEWELDDTPKMSRREFYEQKEDEEEKEMFTNFHATERKPTISNISMSLKNTSLGEKKTVPQVCRIKTRKWIHDEHISWGFDYMRML